MTEPLASESQATDDPRLVGRPSIWPAPPGHRSGFTRERPRVRRRAQLADLITAGALEPGMALYPRPKNLRTRVATLLADGRIDVDGVAYARPSDAAAAIAGKRTGGFYFFLTDQASRRSLRAVRREYEEATAVDPDDDDLDEDDEEDGEE